MCGVRGTRSSERGSGDKASPEEGKGKAAGRHARVRGRGNVVDKRQGKRATSVQCRELCVGKARMRNGCASALCSAVPCAVAATAAAAAAAASAATVSAGMRTAVARVRRRMSLPCSRP